MFTSERTLSVKDANESLQLIVTAAPSQELGLPPVSPSHPFQEWKAMEISVLASEHGQPQTGNGSTKFSSTPQQQSRFNGTSLSRELFEKNVVGLF